MLLEVKMKIQVNEFTMAYSDSGGDGMPLLFIHGYPLNRGLWEGQVAALGEVARVIAPDLRGHGGSQATPPPYSVALYAQDLNALLDVFGIQKPVVVCGLSMGGYIAFEFYRRYASRVAGLILTATRAPGDTPEGKAARDNAAETARQEGVSAIVAAMLPKMMAPGTYEKNPELVARVKAIMARTSLEGILGDLAAMKTRPDSNQTLEEITAPTLVIHGEQDPLIPLSEAQAMASAISRSHMVTIPGAGHLPNLENPGAFNQAVREFLEEKI